MPSTGERSDGAPGGDLGLSPAPAIVRALRNEAQVNDSTGGKGGTRTLDPGIMSCELDRRATKSEDTGDQQRR